MQDFKEILWLASSGMAILALIWIRQYGWKRGLLAFLCRVGWLLPILLAIFPKLDKDMISNALSLKTVHLLIDDSASMQDRESRSYTDDVVSELETNCKQMACRIQVAKLSELGSEVAQGFTPLAPGVKSWLPLTHGDPWIVLSDGGDSQPNLPWPKQVQGMGQRDGKKVGMVLASPHPEQDNIWLEISGGPDFGFDQKAIELEVTVHRRSPQKNEELTVQLQASALGHNLASLNVTFRPGEESLNVSLPIQPLARGTHLIKIMALPIGTETATWDNTVYKSLEVLPNTIGLLHLLGSPSWDGRFVRRYLKSEPKYDMISFFILRDQNDMQLSNERELSLIPFPSERLFNEELPNFRAVVIQNFSLYLFLDPNYQKNLVKFVLNGGGLLFVGGPRALHDIDVSASPLAALLPFKMKDRAAALGAAEDWNEKGAVPYDSQARFQIKMADPDRQKRQLATVYDDWSTLDFKLGKGASYQGLHRLDKVELADEGFTPLLTAEMEDGKESLLAAASYPGKGRAIWIFSDDLWKMAMNPGAGSSRETYHSFLKGAMTWLLREEMQRPLWLQDFVLQRQGSFTAWSAKVRGAAARFLAEGQNWTYRICGQEVSSKEIVRQMVSADQWMVSGLLPQRIQSGLSCELSIGGEHPAFGTVRAAIYGVMPEVFADKDIEGSFHRLQQLSQLSGAELLELREGDYSDRLQAWLRGATGDLGVVNRSDQKLLPDYYWALENWWCFLLLLLLPVEVIVRRWDSYFGSRSGRRPSAEVGAGS